jgi:hypothetical protein
MRTELGTIEYLSFARTIPINARDAKCVLFAGHNVRQNLILIN